MKTIVIESIWPKPHLETAGEIALNFKKKGNNVSFAWIGSDIFWHEWRISKFFKIFGSDPQKRVDAFLKILKQNKINIIETKDVYNTNLIEVWASKFKGNINDLKKYKYKNMPLGMGVASSLITFYNNKKPNLEPIIDKARELLCTSALIYEKSINIILEYKPSRIITFNNRFASSLPIILAARQQKIEILRHERGSNYNKYFLFEFDINDPRNFRNIQKDWIKSKNKNKIKIANNFFKNKINKSFRDEVNKNFTINQIKNFLPPLPTGKKIITYYTSTEYEQEAYINLKYKQFEVFKIFYEHIKKLNDIHLVIRVHPSMSEKNDQNWQIFKNKNVTIISSTSKVDTYALMKKSHIVCGYSSRIVLESAYLNIPTISFKYMGWPKKLGILYGEKKDLIKINLQKALKNKVRFNKEQILAVSYFYSTYGIKYKYYKSVSINKGNFLGSNLEWKSEIFKILEKIGFKNFYFKVKNLYNQTITS
jgi:hypothetical protein